MNLTKMHPVTRTLRMILTEHRLTTDEVRRHLGWWSLWYTRRFLAALEAADTVGTVRRIKGGRFWIWTSQRF